MLIARITEHGNQEMLGDWVLSDTKAADGQRTLVVGTLDGVTKTFWTKNETLMTVADPEPVAEPEPEPEVVNEETP
jgi:hypothetical protein